MKFLQSRFEEYILANEKYNIHPELEGIYNYKTQNLKQKRNLIFYGPTGTGKYTQVLKYIKPFSDSNLKYERKMKFNFQNKREFLIKISDIHFEIDMELLGCNAKLLWNDIYNHILDILSARQNHTGIIVCKNFHKIHSELLDIFYSYLQTLTHKNIHLHYVFITENISFIPDNILDKIVNIKDLTTGNTQLMDPHKKITQQMIDDITNFEKINFIQFRDNIYNMFIYHLDITTCLLDIIRHFIIEKKFNNTTITDVYFKLYKFLKLYNNNYRPIYHLESFIFYLCKVIYGLGDGM